MANISVIIPHWAIKPNLDVLLQRAVRSVASQAMEVIVVVNEGTGMSKAVNQGLRCASGDYFLIMNNDVELQRGALADMCKKRSIVSSVLNGKPQSFWGCFFAFSREVYELIGPMDEGYELTYCDDYDYIMKAREVGIQLACAENVFVTSEEHQTMKHVEGRHAIVDRNRKRFQDKWGISPDAVLA